MSCLARLNFYWLRESKALVGNMKRYPPHFDRWDLLKVTARLQAADFQLQTFPSAQGGQSATGESGGADSLQSSSVGMCPPGLTAISSCRPSQAPCWVERAGMPQGREKPLIPREVPLSRKTLHHMQWQWQWAEQTCCKDWWWLRLQWAAWEPGVSGWPKYEAFLQQPKGDASLGSRAVMEQTWGWAIIAP